MKKRNRVLEAILCAALAVVVFWGYMFAAKDNGVFEAIRMRISKATEPLSMPLPLKGLQGMITDRMITDRFTISGRMAS